MTAKLGDMVESFIDRGQLSLEAMQNYVNEGNLGALLRELTSLSSASANVSATRVRLAANNLSSLVESAHFGTESESYNARRRGSVVDGRRGSVVDGRRASVADGRHGPVSDSFRKRLSKDSHEDASSNGSVSRRFSDEDFSEHLKMLIGRIGNELRLYEKNYDDTKSYESAPAPDVANKYAYYDDEDSSEQLNEKEHEKKLQSWNKEVYESRVFKAFVEERLVRALYQQQLHQRGREIFHHHQGVVEQNMQQRYSMPTPYTRRVQQDKHTEAALAYAIEEAAPRFHDVEALSPRLDDLSMVRRGMSHNTSGIAKPASEFELTRSVQLPPINTLMNPRNQMTSPLPAKETLLPHSARSRRADEHFAKLRPLQLYQLLKFAAHCFESKRLREIAKMREYGLPVPAEPGQRPVIVQLSKIIDDILTKDHGSSDIKLEKYAQLRMSCSSEKGHGMHARIAVFRRMARWDDADSGVEPMGEEQEVACMQLLSWLGIATPTPAERDTRQLLRLKDVAKIIDHLYRLRLIPDLARKALFDIATELKLGKEELTPRMAAVSMCDADVLVWEWMQRWGCWEPALFMPENRLATAPAAAPPVEAAASAFGLAPTAEAPAPAPASSAPAPALTPAPPSTLRGSARGRMTTGSRAQAQAQ